MKDKIKIIGLITLLLLLAVGCSEKGTDPGANLPPDTFVTGYQIELAPHMWGGALMFSAGLQICAVSPAATIVEYSLLHNPMQQELDLDPITATKGEIIILDRPGLGVSINQDFVERFKIE